MHCPDGGTQTLRIFQALRRVRFQQFVNSTRIGKGCRPISRLPQPFADDCHDDGCPPCRAEVSLMRPRVDDADLLWVDIIQSASSIGAPSRSNLMRSPLQASGTVMQGNHCKCAGSMAMSVQQSIHWFPTRLVPIHWQRTDWVSVVVPVLFYLIVRRVRVPTLQQLPRRFRHIACLVVVALKVDDAL